MSLLDLGVVMTGDGSLPLLGDFSFSFLSSVGVVTSSFVGDWSTGRGRWTKRVASGVEHMGHW